VSNAISCGCVSAAAAVSICHPISVLPQVEGADAAENLETLQVLKAQLTKQLSDLDKKEVAMKQALQPQTVAEVDQLQKQLQEALDELKSRRAVLEQQEKAQKEPKQSK
jgi:transcriptional regulator with AAA-type ATPase domain